MYKINGIEKVFVNLAEGESLYFVTDLHGQYTFLRKALNLLGFKDNPDAKVKDTLFIIGDIVDRGSENLELLGFARHNKQVRASRGNHEAIAYYGATKAKASSLPFWEANGGKWHRDKDIYHVTDMLEWAYSLPDGYELHVNGEHKLGLVHASIPQSPEEPLDWDNAVNVFNSFKGCREGDLWSLALEDRTLFRRDDEGIVSGVDALIHGHTIVKNAPRILGNRVYLDGGAGLIGDDFALTILEYRPRDGALLGLFDVHRFKEDPYTRTIEMM